MANQLGWETIVADARAVFATEERLPNAGQIIVAWPDEALEQVKPDLGTAVVVLTHDDKFDLPALSGALATEAFYIGALGSRRNQERRRERLIEGGVARPTSTGSPARCGLDLGADSPAETALSILAEILAVRVGRTGGPLKTAKTRIHVEPSEPAVSRRLARHLAQNKMPLAIAVTAHVGSRRCCCARSNTRSRRRLPRPALLAANDGARALAGGQTLVNVMKARAASPDALVDLNGIDELKGIELGRRRNARDRRR